jgi:hypothetical protein
MTDAAVVRGRAGAGIVRAVTDAVASRASTLTRKVQRVVRRNGVGGTARLALSRAKPQKRTAIEYIWYMLDTERTDRPHPPLEPGLELREGGLDDVPLLMGMDTSLAVSPMSEPLVRLRLEDGSTPWVVLDGDELVFTCWILAGVIPVAGARLHLPEGVAGLEDSIAAKAARGRGIAPATWALLGDRLLAAGQRWILTKIDVDNRASRVAIERAGFEEAALMRIVWRDWRTVIRIALPPGSPHGWIADLEQG